MWLLFFSIKLAERPPVWEGAVRSIYCACLSRTFINICVSAFPLLVLRVGRGI